METSNLKRPRDEDATEAAELGSQPKRPKTCSISEDQSQEGELLRRVLVCVAQQGFASDISPVRETCKALYWSVDLWSLFSKESLSIVNRRSGRTPLMAAAFQGREDRVGWLLKHGYCCPNDADRKGRNALHWVCASQKGNLPVLEAILADPRCDPKVISCRSIPSGQTPFAFACDAKNVTLALRLAEDRRFTVNFQSFDELPYGHRFSDTTPLNAIGWLTPLAAACGNGLEAVVDCLLKKGALVDLPFNAATSEMSLGEHRRCSALAGAIHHGSFAIIQKLVNAGASTDGLHDLLGPAFSRGDRQLVTWAVNKGAVLDGEAFRQALLAGMDEELISYIQHAPDEKLPGKEALCLACGQGNSAIVFALLARKSQHEVVAPVLQGERSTAFTEACKQTQDMTLALQLIERGYASLEHLAGTQGPSTARLLAQYEEWYKWTSAACDAKNGPLASRLLDMRVAYGLEPLVNRKKDFELVKLACSQGLGEFAMRILPLACPLAGDFERHEELSLASVTLTAIRCGHDKLVRYLLSHGIDLKTVTRTGNCPLEEAVDAGQEPVALVLLEVGGVGARGALNLALKKRMSRLALALLEKSYDPKEGGSLLSLASEHGLVDVVKWLLERVDQRTPAIIHALHRAIEGCHLSVAKLLFESASSDDVARRTLLEARDSPTYARSAIHLLAIACSGKQGTWEEREALLLYLLQCGASPDTRDGQGQTLLHLLASAAEGLHLLQALLKLAPSLEINARDGKGTTAFVMACQAGSLQAAKALFNAGANPNLRTSAFGTALKTTIVAANEELIRWLLEEVKVDVHQRGKEDETPLHFLPLCRTESTDVLRNIRDMLVAAGVDKKARDDMDRTPLLRCVSIPSQREDVALMLTQSSDQGYLSAKDANGYTALHLAAKHGLLNLASALVERCPSLVNQRDGQGRTPIFLAIEYRHSDVALAILRSRLADLSVVDSLHRNALSVACTRGLKEVAQQLVILGCNTTAVDSKGYQPINYALEGFTALWPLILWLVEKGADPNAKGCYDEKTPLQLFSSSGSTKSLLRLLELAPTLSLEGEAGHAALQDAVDGGQEKAALLLLGRVHPSSLAKKLTQSLLRSAIKHGLEAFALKLLDVSPAGAENPLSHTSYGDMKEALLMLALERPKKRSLCKALLMHPQTQQAIAKCHSLRSALLHRAVAIEDCELVEILVCVHSVNVDYEESDMTPLMVAAEAGKLQLVQKLCDLGANINATHYSSGKTALLFAADSAETGTVDVTVELIRRGADVTARTGDGQGLFCLAFHRGWGGTADAHRVRSILSAVLARAPAVDLGNFVNSSGRNILHKAASLLDFSAIVELLLQIGDRFQVDAPTHHGHTVLDLVCQRTDSRDPRAMLALVTALVDRGAAIDWPLMFAARAGQSEVCSFLISRGADLEFQERGQFQTALHMAVNSNNSNLQTCRVLIEAMDPTALVLQDKDGNTPLMLAVKSHYPMAADVVRLLLAKCPEAASDWNPHEGDLPIHAVVRRKDDMGEKILAVLLEHDPSFINSRSQGSEQTPLMVAAKAGNTEMVKLLLRQKDIDVRATDPSGRTALDLARSAGYGGRLIDILRDAATSTAGMA
jgi:ankyrin repeat protein